MRSLLEVKGLIIEIIIYERQTKNHENYDENHCSESLCNSKWLEWNSKPRPCNVGTIISSVLDLHPGGYSTGMIEWGQKSKPKKLRGTNISPQKIPIRISEPKNSHKGLNNRFYETGAM